MFLQSEEFETAYAEEKAAFSRFSHPYIMRLLDTLVQEEPDDDSRHLRRVAYLVFPLMKGSLRDQLNDTVLRVGWDDVAPDVRALRLRYTLRQFQQICQAFNVLHSAAYVHQDIKPDNILISVGGQGQGGHGQGQGQDYNQIDGKAGYGDWSGGTPMLTDFGSVRPASVRIENRSKSLIVADEAASYCTVSYRAPELFDPPTGSTIDSRTDVWGIGCLLFAMWFGLSPYESDFVVDDRGQCKIKVADCSHSRVLSKMPRKPERYCTPADVKIMHLSEWILEHDFTKRVYTSDIITAIDEELASL
jgi:serine/threonine kinase 16